MADTKVSALTAVTAPATTDEFPVNQGGASKKVTLAQVRGAGMYFAKDYGLVGNGIADDHAAIQSAMDAAVAGGGGVVLLPPGTISIGTVGITYTGSNVTLRGSGNNATTLVYTGSAGAVRNSNAATSRLYCGLSDLAIDVTGGSAGAKALHVYNFYRGSWERLQLKCGTTTFDGLTLEGDAATSTYYNRFTDVDISTNGTCVHVTGAGPVNRNNFYNGLWEGTGKALVFDCTTTTCDTFMFINQTITCSNATEVMKMGGNGGAVLYCSFINWLFETGTSAAITMAIASGTASHCYFLGGIYGNVTIATQDNMDNHVWIPSEEGLDYMKIGGNGTNGQSMWFERDNGGMTFGSGKDTNLYRGGSNLLTTDDSFELPTGYMQMGSIATPATPSATFGRVYMDASGGLTRLNAVFSDGTVRQLAAQGAAHIVGVPRVPSGSFLVPDGYVLDVISRMTLGGTVRCALGGVGELVLSGDFSSRSRITLDGRGGA